MLLGLFGKARHYEEAPKDKRYGFVVPTWNEEKVIANLIRDIRALDYPQELIDIFVVAHNCTDKTAEAAKQAGAKVYELSNPNERTKGFALKHLFEELMKEYDIEKDFYAFTVLDADSTVHPNYIAAINNYLQASRVDECVGYLNCKNLSENWVSAMCGIQVFQHSVNGLRARSMLNISREVYGCSCTLRSRVLAKVGWRWTSLTEDLEIVLDLAASGYKTGYTEQATCYVEEPNTFKLLWRQCLRWARGGLLAFQLPGWDLLKSFFKKPKWYKYDIFWNGFPMAVVTFWIGLSYQLVSLVLFFARGDSGYFSWMSFGYYVITMFAGAYLGGFFANLLTIIREWKHILLPPWKVFSYLLLFPIYNLIDPIFAAIAVFIRPKWAHIDHHYVVRGADLAAEEAAKDHGEN